MIKQIILDKKIFQFEESLLPCLVVGAHKSGASYFSVTIVANLINKGSKVIFFTAFPMAKEELLDQIGTDKTFDITKKTDLENIPQDKSIIIESGNKELRGQVIKGVKDLENYIIFVKNIEEYDNSILDIIGINNKIILSGDLDNCSFKNNIASKKWESKIIFTVPETALNIQVPILEKYESYLINSKIKGILKIK
ncbi:MAG: hypothetical protein WAZ12_04015 [Candidatus Absconditicoccaceae bacterium]